MKKQIKILALVSAIMIIMSFMFMGCSKKVPEVNRGEEELVLANYRDIRDLNPHLYNGEIFAQNMIFESLVKVNSDGDVEPWLAESWNISEDGKEYTFKLREDVYFSDGNKFNAQSVKANFDAILENRERHSWIEAAILIEEVEVIEEYEFKIKISEAYYPFLTELSLTRPFRFISPSSMINGSTKDGVNGYIGTGPYVLSENKTDEYSIFKVNENYWGDKPEIKDITVKVIPDNATRALALESGEIDLIYGNSLVDSDTYIDLSDRSGFESSISEPTATRTLMMNTSDEILSDVNVRMALEYAMDKELISQGIFSGVESPANTIFSPNLPYCDIKVNEYSYSVEKAIELLEESGWILNKKSNIREKDGTRLILNLNYNSDDVVSKTMAEYFQNQLSAIGVQLYIRAEEKQAYNDRLKSGKFDLIFNNTWGSPYDPQTFLNGMREPGVHGDYEAQQGLKEKAMIDESILKALTTTSEEERREKFSYILNTLQDSAVYIPITYQHNVAVYNDRVKNIQFNSSQYEIPLEKMNIEDND